MSNPIWYCVIGLALALPAGCDDTAEVQREAASAQREADTKIADAKRDAAAETAKAQAEAQAKVVAASADFDRAREAWRHDLTTRLTALDETVAGLDAKSKTATGKAKTQLDAQLALIDPLRVTFGDDFATVDQATFATWDTVRARVEREWTALSEAVAKA